MWKVVLDTNILVSAFWAKQSNPYKVVEMFFKNMIVLYYTDEIVEEYEEVLHREKFGFSKKQIKDFIQELMKNGTLSESITSLDPFSDETDRKFYDAAMTNNALLITGNIKHYPDKPFIMTPFEFLNTFNT